MLQRNLMLISFVLFPGFSAWLENENDHEINFQFYSKILIDFLSLQVFDSLGINTYDLNVDMLDVHAVSNFFSLPNT